MSMDNKANGGKAAADKTAKKSVFSLGEFKINKKTLHIALAAVLLVVILVIYFSTLDLGGKDSDAGAQSMTAAEYCDKTQNELAGFLSSIKGAGKVKCLISFEGTPELIIAYTTNKTVNTNVGEDGRYTESLTENSSPVIITNNGSQTPLILSQVYPKVKGVIVGASGAGDVRVKLSIIDAVRTYLKIDADCVQVYTPSK